MNPDGTLREGHELVWRGGQDAFTLNAGVIRWWKYLSIGWELWGRPREAMERCILALHEKNR